MTEHPLFALTTRGLENVAAQEINELAHISVQQVAYRRIMAQCHGALASVLVLRTVDDVFLDLAHWSGIGRPRSTLATLRSLSASLDLYSAAMLCAQLRPIDELPLFSVSASFVGKRNYSSEEMKFAIAEGIESQHSWSYTDNDRNADLNIRLFIEHEDALLGLRLAQHALHERSYKTMHYPGSLKPPVAAAMLRLAQLQAGPRRADPFCCPVTLVVEGAQVHYSIIHGNSVTVDGSIICQNSFVIYSNFSSTTPRRAVDSELA